MKKSITLQQINSIKIFVILAISLPLYILVILTILSRGYQLPFGKAGLQIFAQSVIDTSPPTAPANLRVSSYLASARSGGSWDVLAWNPSTDDVKVAGYQVYQIVSGNVYDPKPLAEVTNTSYTRKFLVNGYAGDYTYYVIAKDSSGNFSPASNKAHMTGIWGDVMDGANSRYVRGATISATGNNQTFKAVANYGGAYLMNIPVGSYSVVFSASGYKSQTWLMAVNQNQMSVRNVFLVKTK